MFTGLGYNRIVEHIENEVISVIAAYRIVALEAFAENKTGPAIESLRRCVKEIFYSEKNIYRDTQEFEQLIQL